MSCAACLFLVFILYLHSNKFYSFLVISYITVTSLRMSHATWFKMNEID